MPSRKTLLLLKFIAKKANENFIVTKSQLLSQLK